jgi:hypothetical protein
VHGIEGAQGACCSFSGTWQAEIEQGSRAETVCMTWHCMQFGFRQIATHKTATQIECKHVLSLASTHYIAPPAMLHDHPRTCARAIFAFWSLVFSGWLVIVPPSAPGTTNQFTVEVYFGTVPYESCGGPYQIHLDSSCRRISGIESTNQPKCNRYAFGGPP